MSTIGRYWKQLFGVGLAVYGGALITVGATALIGYFAVGDRLHRILSLSAEEDPSSKDLSPLLIALGTVWLVAAVAFVISTAMMYATVAAVLQEAVLGRPTTFSVIWRRAWARVPALTGTVALTALIAVIPVALAVIGFFAFVIGAFTLAHGSSVVLWTSLGFLGALVTAPLAAWLWVKFSLAPSAVVFEGQRPMAALRRSSQLVRGDWWRISGISLLAYGMAAATNYIIQVPFSFLGMFSGFIGGSPLDDDPNPTAIAFAMSGYVVILFLSQLIGQFVSATFPQLVTGLLYVDRRMRTENLGPVLAEAAAVPPQYNP
ncbi:hypothetical protein [Streptomyces sp. NPDC018000]|uniref:hypothetical protein n=1 Tax=Streptomyces sp. NPDC018000 TaxID=3365028 RepID=UPI0037BD1DE1